MGMNVILARVRLPRVGTLARGPLGTAASARHCRAPSRGPPAEMLVCFLVGILVILQASANVQTLRQSFLDLRECPQTK